MAQKLADGVLWFEGLAEPSGHSTIRASIIKDSIDRRSVDERIDELRATLRELGCASERSHISGLFSIDVPPEVPYRTVRRLLETGKEKGLWDYEEGTLAHSP